MNTEKKIILSILTEAQNKNFSVVKTQLVKYFYLVELEYYRSTQKRLTGLQWKFYHYGPYAVELEPILNSPEFSIQEGESMSGRSYKRFSIAEPVHAYYDSVDAKVSVLIKRIVGEWGNKSLQELLDFVYFETEPMQTVKRRGDVLDFSTVDTETIRTVIPLRASKETSDRVSELRKRIAPALKNIAEQRTSSKITDLDYYDALKAWDEESDKEIDPEALNHINLTITQTTHGTGEEGN